VNVMSYDSPPDSTLDDRLSQLEPFLVVGPCPSKRLRIKRITLKFARETHIPGYLPKNIKIMSIES
jgi:hypothetical protein